MFAWIGMLVVVLGVLLGLILLLVTWVAFHGFG